MKIFSIAILAFLLTFATDTFGQKKPISANEFYSLSSKARQKQYEFSRRVETVSEKYSDGNLTESVTAIQESILPDRFRYVIREKIGDKINEAEIITIGDFQYSRQNGGNWTKIDLSKTGGTGTGTGVSGRPVSCRQTTTESVFLNGYMAQLIEELVVNSSDKGLTYNEEKHWISDDGLLLKSEESNGLLSPKIEKSKTVRNYEYNPNIKIEAPIK